MARGEADAPFEVTQPIDQEAMPRGWALTSLGAVIPRPRPKVAPDDSSTLPFLGMDHLEADGFKLLGQDHFRNMKSAGSAFFSGDVLYGRLRPYLNKVHRATFDGVASAEFIVLPPSAAIDAEFLKYLIHQKAFVNFASEHSSGDRPRVNFDAISKFQFVLPPLAEQRRIVSRIDELFSRIEAGERAIEEARAGLKRYRKAILKAAVTGALTEDWRAANPPKETGADLLARILEARRTAWLNAEIEKLKAKGKPAPKTAAEREKLLAKYAPPKTPEADDLPEVPTGWVWASLAQLTLIKGGVTVDKKRQPENPVTLPYLRVANVQAGRIDLSEIKEITVEEARAQDCLLKAGDILLNEGGDLDKLGRGWVWYGQIDPCIHQNHVFRARPVSNLVAPEYVSHYANAMGQTFFMEKGKQSVNLASISLTAISALPVPLPPPAEQTEIVSRVEEALSRADAAEATLDAQSRAARALKQSILKAAFTGRLVPQDPADEPASELLKRVKEAAA